MNESKSETQPISRVDRVRKRVRDAVTDALTPIDRLFDRSIESWRSITVMVIIYAVGLAVVLVLMISESRRVSILSLIPYMLVIAGSIVTFVFLATGILHVISHFVAWLMRPDKPTPEETVEEALDSKIKGLNAEIASLEQERERLETIVALQDKNAELARVLATIRKYPDVADLIDNALKKRAAKESRHLRTWAFGVNLFLLIAGWLLAGLLSPIQFWQFIH